MNENLYLGIELGSTRIKAVLIIQTTILSPPEILHGKAGWKTDTGRILWMRYGREYVKHTRALSLILERAFHHCPE